MSGIYATLESAQAVLSRDPHQWPSVRHRLRCRRDPHQRPSDVGIYSWICSMNVARVLAARGTGGDLSIQRLEPTILSAHTLRSELARAVAIRFSPSGVLLNYQCLCKPRVQVEERDLVRSSISRLPPTRRMRGAAQWCMH